MHGYLLDAHPLKAHLNEEKMHKFADMIFLVDVRYDEDSRVLLNGTRFRFMSEQHSSEFKPSTNDAKSEILFQGLKSKSSRCRSGASVGWNNLAN
jgi:hypothetical protein